MSQTPKPSPRQVAKTDDDAISYARRGWAGALGKDAGTHTALALARAGFKDPTLVLRWTEIAGASVAAIASPSRLQDGPNGAILTLRCDPGVAVFLQHETRGLISRLNDYLGAGRIARIRLAPGAGLPAKPENPHPLRGRTIDVPPSTDLKSALERLALLRKALRK